MSRYHTVQLEIAKHLETAIGKFKLKNYMQLKFKCN